MRIVIDLQGAQSISRFRGIGRYSLALATAMAREARGHEIWLAVNASFPDSLVSIREAFAGLLPPERIRSFHLPAPLAESEPGNAWRMRAAERIREAFLAALQPDLVFVSSLFEGMIEDIVGSVGLQHPELLTAVTLYDLIPLLNPAAYLADPLTRAWYERKVASLCRADLLLAISDYAGQEALSTLKLPEGKVAVISAAAEEIFRPLVLSDQEAAGLRQRYGLDRPFVMYSGAVEVRKNLPRLFEAFARLPEPLKQGHCLLCAGRISEAEQGHLRELAGRLGIEARLRLPGYVPDADLVALYSTCALFVLPSLHEGFGLPALEAMSCGAPTIGSDTTSIPEVIGCPAALFPPEDAEAISRLMARVLSDGDFRRFLREHGLRQADKFSWEASAKRALTAMEAAFAAKAVALAPGPAPRRGQEEIHRELGEALAALPEAHSDADLAGAALASEANRQETAGGLPPAAPASAAVARLCPANPPPSPSPSLPGVIGWRIEGPFDSAYSLALLNRETARALAGLGHRVMLHSADGPGDFPPDPEFLLANPDLAAMHAADLEAGAGDYQVESRNLYPPRVHDMTAPVRLLHHYAWEESGFPLEWVDSFNRHLQGITCLSRHVQKILIDHGVTVPLAVSGCGVDHWERIEVEAAFRLRAKPFRFLHVSSCFPRKGIDVLLDAFAQAFSAADPVSLVIKTFANPHHEIRRELEERRALRADFPEVLLLEEKMSDGALKALYQQSHCLVAPSRAEGFGLPLAEAMLSGLPVITTGWGGQMDFCSAETAWLLDYTFRPAASHFQLHDSVWAEPEPSQLAALLRELYHLPAEERLARPARGRALLLARFRWSEAARRLEEAARAWALPSAAPLSPSTARGGCPETGPTLETGGPRIGWVSTWNSRCGIACYSAHLLDHLPAPVKILACRAAESVDPDGPEVSRCWTLNNHAEEGDDLSALAAAVEENALDTLVIQFNYGFFHLEHLARFIEAQSDRGRRLVLMLHSTVDREHLPQGRLAPIAAALARCARLCVHSVADLNRLKALGLVANVVLFPHSIPEHPAPPLKAPKPYWPLTIASYGFFLGHKGLAELIEALALLRREGRNVRLLMVNAAYSPVHSAPLIAQARDRVAALGLSGRVRIDSRYLSDAASLALLGEADLVVFPYQQTGESSSAAARIGLASGRPVAVTPLAIFDDLGDAVLRLPGSTPVEIAAGIAAILDGLGAAAPAIGAGAAAADRWRRSHTASRIARRLHGMLVALGR